MPCNILETTNFGAEEQLWEQQKVARLTPSPEMAFISILGDKIAGLRNHSLN